MRRLLSRHLAGQVHGNLGLSIDRDDLVSGTIDRFDLDAPAGRHELTSPHADFTEGLSG